jgi:hypothetical protein
MTQFANNPLSSLPELRSNSKAIQNMGQMATLLDSPRIRFTNSGNDVVVLRIKEGSVG